jgi:uncharacterized membrane protein (UPF0127 family)
MSMLHNRSKNEIILNKLEIAESFFARGRGLLGRNDFNFGEGLWIRPCNNIHTLFMKFSIDCVFIDSKMRVTKIVHQLKPWRVVGPIWKSSSVIELPSGFAASKNIEVGDELYVGN